ncbi:MAG: indolepyruvate oxidoreductase subunit beta [Lachnospiraceae bacterium]|nr:indolepyruvate oxidoreductase subunit beta [Lachnospiraceae bacterium]
MDKDILICGVGGQGTVLVSKIISAAAMEEGNTVHSAETIGMAQRGGSVTSHVRIGENALSPLVPLGSANLLLAFEPGEAVRNLKYLSAGGIAIVNTAHTVSVTAALSEETYSGVEMCRYLEKKCPCIFINSDEIAGQFGSHKFFNIYLLGVACGSGALGLKRDSLSLQVEKKVPEKYAGINKEVFNCGCDYNV